MYRTYSLYYLVLHCSSDLCAAYLDNSAALTQSLRALSALTQLVEATDPHYPPTLKMEWWRYRSGQPPSTTRSLPLSEAKVDY